MDKILNFPNNQKTVENEIAKQNQIYLEGIRDRMTAELNALIRTNNEAAISTGKVISDMLNCIVDRAIVVFKNSPEFNTRAHAPAFLNQCMQSINAILAGGVISPLTGDEAEWADVTVAEDVGQKFKTVYRGNEYEITIESVQVNVRYPKIYRLNGDNRFAHRIDYFQFHDATQSERVHLTADSIRFIQFPYTMQAIHSHCIISENKITDYLDFEYDEIANGLVYPDQSNGNPESYVIAPKIPFHALKEFGIHVEDEIAEFINYMNESNSYGFEDDDDEFEDDEDIDDSDVIEDEE